MTKTLVINYTPRRGSYSKILLDEFVQIAQNKTKMSFLDLAKTPPDLLLEENLNLLMEWNAGKRNFSKQEQAILANHHRLIDQLLEADNIVLAFPIYNFTMPATVKAWVDAIVVSDKTFSFHPESGFSGLCGNKKALSIIVSGFEYNPSGGPKEYATATLKQNFDFMGIASQEVRAFGVDQNREHLASILNKAKAEIAQHVAEWFPD
jgi:FMN-dependent NADH-azoreductase